MSGIYIPGMEMPTSCAKCKLFGEYGCPFIGAVGYALTRGERNDDCPLVPVPEHGRLVDADALEEYFVNDPSCLTIFDAIKKLQGMPTIIPADKEGDNDG